MWGAGSPTNDAPVHATEDTAPVAATSAGVYSWPKSVRPCYFWNNTVDYARITINSDTGPTATEYDFVVPTLTSIRLDLLGAVNIKQVRVWYDGAVAPRVDPIGWYM